MRKLDSQTGAIVWAINFFIQPYSARTSVGIVLGALFWFLSELFAPSLRSLTFVNFSGVPWYGWLAPGLAIVHVPTILSMLRRQPTGDEKLDRVFEMIERGNFSEAEQRRLIRTLIDRVADGIVPSKQLQEDLNRIEQRITSARSPTQPTSAEAETGATEGRSS